MERAAVRVSNQVSTSTTPSTYMLGVIRRVVQPRVPPADHLRGLRFVFPVF